MTSKPNQTTEYCPCDETRVLVTPSFFQRHLETTILIDAIPEKVYTRMTELASYCQWSPLISKVDGDLRQGGRLNMTIDLKGIGTMRIRPQVVNLEQNRELRWIGRFLFKGLFDGEHYFTLKKESNGQTTLRHGEKFSGLLVPLLWRLIGKGTIESFLAHNVSLKQRIERKGS